MNEEKVKRILEQAPQTQVDPEPNTRIVGAVSPETAVLVSDYPYGSRLRCVMRYWLEARPGKGTRVMQQTNNPKRPGLFWNKPKASTYTAGAVVLYTNADGHVKSRGIDGYIIWNVSTVELASEKIASVDAFTANYAAALTDADRAYLKTFRLSLERRIEQLTTPHVKVFSPKGHGEHCPTCRNFGEACTGTTDTDFAKADAPAPFHMGLGVDAR